MKPMGPSDHLDDAQLARLLGVFDLREQEGRRRYAIVLALAKLGVRKSELCDANREDLQLYNQRMTLRVWRAKTARRRARPDSRQQDRLLVDKELHEALQAYWRGIDEAALGTVLPTRAGNGRSGLPLFLTHPSGWAEGQPNRLTARSVDLIVADAAQRSGLAPDLRISPHSLRATAATMMLRAGVDLATVARTLGHRNVNSVMPYVRATGEDVFKAQETIRPGRTKPKR